MPSVAIPVGQLLLDVENPRHPVVQSQREAILALLDKEGAKLVKLADHIAKNGLSPIDVTLVMKKGQNYVVLEGNRRLAAIRLLDNPGLAEGSKYEKDFKRIAKGATVPDELDCAVVSSREDAAIWIKLRQTGQNEGVGVSPWGAMESQRFDNRPGSQGGKAIAFLDTIQEAFPKNAALQANREKLGTTRLTTLGRLVADPAFRNRFGLVEAAGRFHSHFPADALEEAVEQLTTDLVTKLSVTNIKTKDQRLHYLDTLPEPEADSYRAEAQPLVPGLGALAGGKKRARRPTPPQPGPLFKDVVLKKLGTRIPTILSELRKLDPGRYPNATAVLCRVLLELSVDHFYERKKWQKDKELKDRVRRCLNLIDQTGKDPAYQAVRTGLSDPNSLYAMRTLHGYVHNPRFHPQASEVRAIASNLGPYLSALDAIA